MLLFGPKRDENEEWRKLHNEECCYNNERPTEQKHTYTRWDDGGK